MKFVPILLLLLAGCPAATKSQVRDAVELNEAQAVVYTDLAVFARGLLIRAEQSAPPETKQFFKDALTALDENVGKFEKANRDLMRLIASLEEIDPATQQKYFDQITDLIIAAKTGKLPEVK